MRSVDGVARCAAADDGGHDVKRSGASQLRRYTYAKGKAVVFGSRFEHSTEPGAGADGEVHAYLCFTFGTDLQARWPAIAETLDTQSRIAQQPDGELRLTAVGRAIEDALRDLKASGAPQMM